MQQGDKITIIWDEHEPPKNYIWCHNGKAYEHDGEEWKESEYKVADFKHNGNKATMIFESNTIPPDNYIWNKDGDLYVCEDGLNWVKVVVPVNEPTPVVEPVE